MKFVQIQKNQKIKIPASQKLPDRQQSIFIGEAIRRAEFILVTYPISHTRQTINQIFITFKLTKVLNSIELWRVDIPEQSIVLLKCNFNIPSIDISM